MGNVSFLTEKLCMEGWLRDEEFLEVFIHYGENEIRNLLTGYARKTAHRYYGNKVYTRGSIEFSSYCHNDYCYCDIRRSNSHTQRYRLKKEDILTCCDEGYNLGLRTSILQSGKDGYYTDELLIEIITGIRRRYPDCAIILSPGEKEKEGYWRHYDIGADRYLPRHETNNTQHYRCLHPKELTSEHRRQCLRDLEVIGFQTGCGTMVGSPSQMLKHIVEDLYFMKEFQSEMVGIGPFLPHHDTPLYNELTDSFMLTLTLLSIIHLILPDVLLPITAALDTINPQGREQGILAGANVVMLNLSLIAVRKKYILYDNKIRIGDEAIECKACPSSRTRRIGYELVTDHGDGIRELEGKRICTINIHWKQQNLLTMRKSEKHCALHRKTNTIRN